MRIVCDCGVTVFDSETESGYPPNVVTVHRLPNRRYVALSVITKPGEAALVIDCSCGVRVLEIRGPAADAPHDAPPPAPETTPVRCDGKCECDDPCALVLGHTGEHLCTAAWR